MIVLGLGSNCGDRLDTIRKAIQHLRSSKNRQDLQIVAISPIYESDALLPEDAPASWNHPYLNLTLLCESTLSPIELLKRTQAAEIALGRQKRQRWAPREIDIDILAMDSIEWDDTFLKIPHPELIYRPFAILPFSDIAPFWKFPKSSPHCGRTIDAIAKEWRTQEIEKVPFRTRRTLAHLVQLVGILNITPDSFSDGGDAYEPNTAQRRANLLIQQGAEILDIGGESTRPLAQPIPHEEEWKRIAPLLERMPAGVKISVDTRHPEIASRAIQAGAHWINDVTGFANPEMKQVVAESEVDLVMMHSCKVPPDPHATIPQNIDPVSFLLQWAEHRIDELVNTGINRNRIIFDPGFGFGKTVPQTWEILRRISTFQELGVRILIGHSKKSFLSALTQLPAKERGIETLSLSLNLAPKGINFLRIHDIDLHNRSLKTWALADGVSRCQN